MLPEAASGQCNSAMNWGGDGNIWFAGGAVQMGQHHVGGSRRYDQALTRVASLRRQQRKADSFTVGAIHNLSKRTSVFGGYQHVYVTNPNGAAANDLAHATGSYTAPGLCNR